MSAQSWSRHLLVVRLPREPKTYDEIDRVIQVAIRNSECDIILDFADVEILDPPSLSQLAVLHRILEGSTRRLGFCNRNTAVRSVFKTHKMARILDSDWNMKLSIDPADQQEDSSVVLEDQDRNKTQERRGWVRFNLTQSLRLTGLLWRHAVDRDPQESEPPEYWHCTLVDVSEGGVQVVIDLGQELAFSTGQYIILRFSPMVGEKPVRFEAQIRSVLPTADVDCLCLGLQFIGLNVNTEGRDSIQRLIESKGRYFDALGYDAEVHPVSKSHGPAT